MKKWPGLVVLVVLALGGALAAFAGAGQAVPPAEDGRRAFLPVVERGPRGAALLTPSPTLGPSPTPSRTPTPVLGPTPTPTPGPAFVVLTAGCPYWVGPGATVVFTVGLLNAQDVPVQVSLQDTVPEEMQIVRVYAAVTPTVAGDSFTLQMVVAPQWTENVFVFVTVTDACNCYVTNTAAWSAAWNGGSGSGTAVSNPIYLTVHPSPTPTPTVPPPTRAPTSAPTLGPSPTPTAGE
jgi:hypothetical protein